MDSMDMSLVTAWVTPAQERRAPKAWKPFSYSGFIGDGSTIRSDNFFGSALVVRDVSSGAPEFTPMVMAIGAKTEPVDAGGLSTNSAEQLGNRRIALLRIARNSPKPSSEVLRRIEMVEQKLAQASPRVTEGQLSALENSANIVARSRANSAARAELLKSVK